MSDLTKMYHWKTGETTYSWLATYSDGHVKRFDSIAPESTDSYFYYIAKYHNTMMPIVEHPETDEYFLSLLLRATVQ